MSLAFNAHLGQAWPGRKQVVCIGDVCCSCSAAFPASFDLSVIRTCTPVDSDGNPDIFALQEDNASVSSLESWCIEFPTWYVGPGKLSTDYLCTIVNEKTGIYAIWLFSTNLTKSHEMMPHCRVLPPGEFTVMISVSWSCHIAGLKNSIRHIENRFSQFFNYFFVFLMQFGLWRAATFVLSPIHLFDTERDLLATANFLVVIKYEFRFWISGMLCLLHDLCLLFAI